MPPKTPRKPSTATVNVATPVRPAVPHVMAIATKRPSPTAISQLWQAYLKTTPARLKLIDSFLVFTMLSGMAVFAYCILVTDFPFNAFLGAFAACIGQFVLLASLRSQVNPENKVDFPTISPERAFADFAFASVVLHFFAFNFLG